MASQPLFDPHYLYLEHRGPVVVAELNVAMLSDEINLDECGQQLFDLVEQQGFRKLVVNLRNVQYMTSSGIGKLIALHRKMHRKQGWLVLSELQPRVQTILQTSNLLSYFRLAAGIEEAVALLQNPPEA